MYSLLLLKYFQAEHIINIYQKGSLNDQHYLVERLC